MIDRNLRDIWGAVYLPARAYNAFLFWRDYEPHVTTRDFGYAAKLRLNALRVFLSYEYWLAEPDKFQENFDHLLHAAGARSLRVLPVLFDRRGLEPTPDNLRNRDPLTGACCRSPAEETLRDAVAWDGPRTFTTWFAGRYASDDRLLALEVAAGPGSAEEMKFARNLLITARQQAPELPLTVGTARLEDTRFFLDLGLDVLQMQEDFPLSEGLLRQSLRQAVETQDVLGRPLWLGQWQRLRPGVASAAGGEPSLKQGDLWQPAYATMCDLVRGEGLAGAFFFSLMVKPGWTLEQRRAGTLNGVFHEDGAVWSLQDARAISGDLRLFTVERREWPDFAKPIRQEYLDRR